jgi:predicted nucleotidyltransferase component of viral defense system
MNKALTSMLSKYSLRNVEDHINALREILQEIALCGLWRAKFFEHAAFYGGTALRILHGIERFSEDMDFSLLARADRFDLTPYCTFLTDELSAWGFSVKVEKKEKTADSAVESAFLKANTREQLLLINAGTEIADVIHRNRTIRIKIEVDTDPPAHFSTETRFLLVPVPFSVRTYDLPSFFAGKLHAILCRGWKSRAKGRDWYDFVWHVGRETPLNLLHLEARLRQTGHYQDSAPLDLLTVKRMLMARIDQLDIRAVKADVERFLVHPTAIEVWSKPFFQAITEKLFVINGDS